jgi:outer membrane protein assembly factor BamD
VLFLAGVVLLSSCSSKFMKLQKSGSTDVKLKAAIVYYKQANYYKASVLFEELVPLLKGDSLAETAQFYNAYCNYHQRQYSLASYMFKSFYSTYARSPLAEEAYYMYAYAMYEDSPDYNLDQTNTLTAIDALQTFLDTFPESQYAEECTEKMKELREKLETKGYEKAKLYFKTKASNFGNYKAAIVAIDNFQKDFPDSKYLEDLAFTKVQAQYEYAEASLSEKQKARFIETTKFYEEFIDKFPKSRFLKQSERFYENSNKAVADITKAEQLAKEEQAKAKAEEAAAKKDEKVGKNK